MKKTLPWVIIGIIIVITVIYFFPSINYSGELNKYYENIDYSCNTNTDCVVKDIGKCCGGGLACVNNNADADPNYVSEICAKGHLASDCSIPYIISCSCVDGKCHNLP